jgi:hypothetical protein
MLERKYNMAPYLLRSGRPPNAGLPKIATTFVLTQSGPTLLLVLDVVCIMIPRVAGKKQSRVDSLGEVGSRAGEQETDDKTEESEDGTEDLDDKNLDEPV